MKSKEPATDPGPVFLAGRHGIRYPAHTYAQALLGLVRAGEELERRLDADLRRTHGIGLRGFEVLLHLAVFSPDGSLRMTELAQQAPLSQSRVSRLVAELEAQGFITRLPDEADSRAVQVAITDRGVEKLREAQETHHRGLETHFFSRLSRAEIGHLARITRKLLTD
jgi:DNA-binding MarR family transcriptional regulator